MTQSAAGTVGAVCLIGAAGYFGKALHAGRSLARIEQVALVATGSLGLVSAARAIWLTTRPVEPQALAAGGADEAAISAQDKGDDGPAVADEQRPSASTALAGDGRVLRKLVFYHISNTMPILPISIPDMLSPLEDGIEFRPLTKRQPDDESYGLLVFDVVCSPIGGGGRPSYAGRANVAFRSSPGGISPASLSKGAQEFGQRVLWIFLHNSETTVGSGNRSAKESLLPSGFNLGGARPTRMSFHGAQNDLPDTVEEALAQL